MHLILFSRLPETLFQPAKPVQNTFLSSHFTHIKIILHCQLDRQASYSKISLKHLVKTPEHFYSLSWQTGCSASDYLESQLYPETSLTFLCDTFSI